MHLYKANISDLHIYFESFYLLQPDTIWELVLLKNKSDNVGDI